ncbi:hypothetical protein PCE1_001302 [Barthelona sp. PCE]
MNLAISSVMPANEDVPLRMLKGLSRDIEDCLQVLNHIWARYSDKGNTSRIQESILSILDNIGAIEQRYGQVFDNFPTLVTPVNFRMVPNISMQDVKEMKACLNLAPKTVYDPEPIEIDNVDEEAARMNANITSLFET